MFHAHCLLSRQLDGMKTLFTVKNKRNSKYNPLKFLHNMLSILSYEEIRQQIQCTQIRLHRCAGLSLRWVQMSEAQFSHVVQMRLICKPGPSCSKHC